MKKLLWLLLISSAFGQSFVTVTASNIGNGGSGLLPSGTIVFQATGNLQQPISYQVGGGGQQILAPTICPITNGAIVGVCSVANVLLTQPQNICFNVVVKNSAGQVVLGGRNSGYQCLQPQPNNFPWCTAGVCNFDTYPPNLPSTIILINMPFPQQLTLGGIYAGDCSPGTVVIGYGVLGHPDCGPGGSGGGGVWGTITGTLSNQLDLATALALLAPLASPPLTGTPTTPNAPTGDSSTQIVNTNWVRLQGFATLASPNFTGVPTVPTQSLADSSTEAVNSLWVQSQGYSTSSGNVTGAVSSVNNDIVLFSGTSGKVIADAGFGFPLAPAHIGTLVAGSNGLVASATTDTTNAANIASGTLNAARLPLPTSTTVGGVKSYAAVAHQWLNSLSTSGAFAGSQPACADLSNAATSCATDATNATNIMSGTLAIARLGTLVAGQNGLAASATTDTTNATNITSGTLAIARLGTLVAGQNGLAASATTDTTNASNISSGTLAAARLPLPTSSTVGAVNSFALVSHQWLNSLSTAGAFAASQPACGDLSNGANSCSIDATNATNITSGTLAWARLPSTAFSTLTDGAAITWAVGSNLLANSQVTLGGNRTLNVTGLLAGGSYVLKVIQDGTGGRGLALGTGCTWKVSGSGGGAITPTSVPGATDVLAFVFDGTNCYANFAKNYN